jgi:hypothetical protein
MPDHTRFLGPKWAEALAIILVAAPVIFAVLCIHSLLTGTPYWGRDAIAYAWNGELWYSIKYHVPVDRISIGKKPHDCDFWSAPIGRKNCHYEEQAGWSIFAPIGSTKSQFEIWWQRVAD